MVSKPAWIFFPSADSRGSIFSHNRCTKRHPPPACGRVYGFHRRFIGGTVLRAAKSGEDRNCKNQK